MVIGLEKSFGFKMLKILCPGHMFISDLNGEEIVKTFYEKELQKTNQREFRAEKVIKRKDDKLYVKWNNGIDTSGLIKKQIIILRSKILKVNT